MKGGGKVNYTSSSLARAKSKTKNSSPTRPKPSSSALFPTKTLILTPKPKSRPGLKVKDEMELEEPTQSDNTGPKYKEVMSKEDWMKDSDFAMARDASSVKREEKEKGGWWVDFGQDGAGRVFDVEVKGILSGSQAEVDWTGMVKEEEKGASVKREGHSSAAILFDRSDCLGLPHWLRRLPRSQAVAPETPQRR